VALSRLFLELNKDDVTVLKLFGFIIARHSCLNLFACRHFIAVLWFNYVGKFKNTKNWKLSVLQVIAYEMAFVWQSIKYTDK
jgi:hypothetical protein